MMQNAERAKFEKRPLEFYPFLVFSAKLAGFSKANELTFRLRSVHFASNS